MYIYLVLLSIYYLNIVTSYPIQQWKKIRLLLQHNSITLEMKEQLQNKIYKDHVHKWTLKNSWEFKRKFNKIKVIRDADIYELNYYSIRGLSSACKNYEGYASFYIYAKPIIYYSLLESITDLSSMTRLPHRLIVNREWKNANSKLYNKLMKAPTYASHITEYDYNVFSVKYLHPDKQIDTIINIVNDFDPKDKLLFYYLYDVHTLAQIRTNSHVAKLMCCSNEIIRININRIKKEIGFQLKFYNCF